MGVLSEPFGGVMNMLFVLGGVLVAIVLVVWLLKLVSNGAGNMTRGRNRRLAVVDTLALDPKRQLVIIRRDDVEHLILTGGPHDLVIESGIAIDEQPAAQPTRRPVPMVAARKGANPAKPAAPAAAPTPVVPPQPAMAINEQGSATTAMDRLRELGQPADKRAHLSLRHTGLLRPVSESEPVSPENSVTPAVRLPDSAKEDLAQRQVEGTGFEGSEANRN